MGEPDEGEAEEAQVGEAEHAKDEEHEPLEGEAHPPQLKHDLFENNKLLCSNNFSSLEAQLFCLRMRMDVCWKALCLSSHGHGARPRLQ